MTAVRRLFPQAAGPTRRFAPAAFPALAFLAALPGVGAPLAALQDVSVSEAASRGDLARVEELIAEGADVDAPLGDGMTALHWAALAGDGAMAATLLDAGAGTDPVTRNGSYAPLHLAARSGHGAMVRLLLERGASAEARTSDETGGADALHFAAASGNEAAVGALLDAGADPDAREEAWGQTPLMFAAASGRVGAVRLLLERGASVARTSKVMDVTARYLADQEDRRRRNARMGLRADAYDGTLAVAVETVAERVLPRFLDPGEPLSGLTVEVPSEFSDADSLRRPVEEPEPLSYAELVGGHGGLTALLHAVREGHGETAFALVEGGADIDQASAGDRTTPLLMAMVNGHFDLGLELLELGADPTLASDAGTTPLYAAINTHWAPKSRYPQQHAYRNQVASYLDVAEALLDAGADPDARLSKHLWYMSFNFDLLRVDTRGATPFWRAAYALDVEAMELLRSRGADPTVPTMVVPSRRGGESDRSPDPSGLPPVRVDGPAVHPIHAAAGVGYGEGFAANSHRHVPDGWLPAVRYLVEEVGADVDARDHNGYSALHHAAARGDTELILYLVEHGADVTFVSRRGQTTADMANGPYQRTQPYPKAVALLESLGSRNNRNCVSCQ